MVALLALQCFSAIKHYLAFTYRLWRFCIGFALDIRTLKTLAAQQKGCRRLRQNEYIIPLLQVNPDFHVAFVLRLTALMEIHMYYIVYSFINGMTERKQSMCLLYAVKF